MPGAVCLQGGAEFGPTCRAMDAAVLERAGGRGPVVVAPLASAPGPEAMRAARGAEQYYRSLGAEQVRTVLPPDGDAAVAEAAEALRSAGLVVLPGGSPSRLLAALGAATREPLRGALRAVLDADGVLSGASAGAMVLAGRTVLPDRAGTDGPPVVEALGFVPGTLVLPHHGSGTDLAGGLLGRLAEHDRAAVLDGLVVLGLPECGGLLVEDPDGARRAQALGDAATVVARPGDEPRALEPGAEVVL